MSTIANITQQLDDEHERMTAPGHVVTVRDVAVLVELWQRYYEELDAMIGNRPQDTPADIDFIADCFSGGSIHNIAAAQGSGRGWSYKAVTG